MIIRRWGRSINRGVRLFRELHGIKEKVKYVNITFKKKTVTETCAFCNFSVVPESVVLA